MNEENNKIKESSATAGEQAVIDQPVKEESIPEQPVLSQQAADTAQELESSETEEDLTDSLNGEPGGAEASDSSSGESSSDDDSQDSSATDSDESSTPAPAKKQSPYADQMEWYVVNAHSSFELKAKAALEEQFRIHDMSDYLGEVLVPQETVVELVRGERKTSNRKFFPGYMLVQMVLNEDTWHLVKETPKVSGFIGNASDPEPLLEEEVQKIIGQVEQGAAAPTARVDFEQGQLVKVKDGAFKDFQGSVDEIFPDKGRLRVLITIFGRATPVELEFIEVEKVRPN